MRSSLHALIAVRCAFEPASEARWLLAPMRTGNQLRSSSAEWPTPWHLHALTFPLLLFTSAAGGVRAFRARVAGVRGRGGGGHIGSGLRCPGACTLLSLELQRDATALCTHDLSAARLICGLRPGAVCSPDHDRCVRCCANASLVIFASSSWLLPFLPRAVQQVVNR